MSPVREEAGGGWGRATGCQGAVSCQMSAVSFQMSAVMEETSGGWDRETGSQGAVS